MFGGEDGEGSGVVGDSLLLLLSNGVLLLEAVKVAVKPMWGRMHVMQPNEK